MLPCSVIVAHMSHTNTIRVINVLCEAKVAFKSLTMQFILRDGDGDGDGGGWRTFIDYHKMSGDDCAATLASLEEDHRKADNTMDRVVLKESCTFHVRPRS